jgi:hypothetical protein
MNREIHVPLREGVGVRFPRATRPDMVQKPLNIRVKGHLVPFGRPKWDISKITISCVSTDSSYFSSDTPCAYLDVASNTPLRLYHIENCLPDFDFPTARVPFDDEEQDAVRTVHIVKDALLKSCEFDSDFERRFLDFYIVTLEGRGCQRQIAEKIQEQGADYVLAVKANQKELYQAIEDYF